MNKTHQKVIFQYLCSKCPPITAQTTVPLGNCCCNLEQMFFLLFHIMDPQTVDPLLKDNPRCCSPPDSNPPNWVAISLRDEIWHLSQCHMHDVISLTSSLRHHVTDVMVNLPLRLVSACRSCMQKIMKIPEYL